MSNNQMREYINAVSFPARTVIDEGIVSNIKNWIKGLSDPVRLKGQQMASALEKVLTNRYAAKVPDQVKKANKSWAWSRLTYKDLYLFASQQMKMTDEEIDRALKNPIVNNNLKQLVRAMPAGAKPPALPLKSSTIQNNSSVISSTIDKQNKEFLSKAIAVAVIDGLAYIDQEKADAGKPSADQEPAPARPSGGEPATAASTGTSAPAAKELPTTPEDMKTAIDAIRSGLAKMKGAA